MAKAINIILDESNPHDPLFIEIENDAGASVGIGERINYDGLIKIRITPEDIRKA